MIQLLLKKGNNFISISYPRQLGSDTCNNLFFKEEIAIPIMSTSEYISSKPYIQDGIFDPIIKLGVSVYIDNVQAVIIGS